MHNLDIIIGYESSQDELAGVKDAFRTDRLEVTVKPALMRMSHDWQSLPMTIMVFAQALAPNVVWDLVKMAAKKLFVDSRMEKRTPTIVVKRKNYDVIVGEKGIFMRSYQESIGFSSIDELIAYEQELSQSPKSTDKDT